MYTCSSMYVRHIMFVSLYRCRSRSCFFFFQAEDGIRDLVRSRGLGDVYKRQEGYIEFLGFLLLFMVVGAILGGIGGWLGAAFSGRTRPKHQLGV